MYRQADEKQWETYEDKPFSLNLTEAFHEALADADPDDLYGSVARSVFPSLSKGDKERLAFEALRARAGSCVRTDRRPARRSANGSARWDTVSEARRAGLEDHYVQTGERLKPLLECTAWDLDGAVAYYRQCGQAFFDKADRYDRVKKKLASQGAASVSELDRATVERILDV